MDPVTHATSGALLALSCRHRPTGFLPVALAALASASPDIDVFFSPSPVDFLLLHRGITHALMAVPFMGLLLALCMVPWWRGGRRGAWAHGSRLFTSTARPWTFGETFVLAMALVLLHIWLDCVTTYGTLIFLPFSEYRVRLNGIFIVDFLLFIPMLLALLAGRARRGFALAGLLWVFIYPGAAVGLNMLHQKTNEERLASVTKEVTVLPDALAPLYWRVVYQTNTPFSPANAAPAPAPASGEDAKPAAPAGPLVRGFTLPPATESVHHQGLDWRGAPRTKVRQYPAASAAMTSSLARVSTAASAFFDFTLMPVVETRESGAEKEYAFYDLRFATMLPFVQDIMNKRNNGQPSFLLLAKEAGGSTEEWKALRMLFSGADRDSAWHSPKAPQKPTWWQWAVGLR